MSIFRRIIESLKQLNFFKLFNNLAKREKTMVILFLAVLLPAIYYKAFFLSTLKNTQRLKIELASVNAKTAEVRAKIPDIVSAQNELNLAKRDFQEAQTRMQLIEENLPSQDSMPRFLGELVRQGQDLQIDFISIKPKAAKDNEDYLRLNIEVRVNATYNNFVNYLHRLENISKFLAVSSANIEEAKEASSRGVIEGRVVLSTLLGSSSGSGAELKLAETLEDLKLGRSPFASKIQGQVGQAGIVLSGINWMGGQKVAIINNNAYLEGQTVENMLIKQILPNMVILFDQATNETYTLVLDIERSANE